MRRKIGCAKTKAMPYLDWTQKPVALSTTSLTAGKLQLTLGLRVEEIRRLEADLSEVYFQGGSELRMGLPNQWVLFWKKREDGSRAIVAHPQPEEWVGTVALDESFGRQFISALQGLAAEGRNEGGKLTLSQIGSLASVSNLELILLRES